MNRIKQRSAPVSQQQAARKTQNYVERPTLKVCENCEYYRSIFVDTEWGRREEKRRRCALGKFAVKRSSSCDAHVFA